jgi:hypothetical protein
LHDKLALEESDVEADDKLGENATVARLHRVLASGQILSDFDDMPEIVRQSNSYSHHLVTNHRDLADSFSTTDEDPPTQHHNDYNHRYVPKNRSFADSLSTIDGVSTKQPNNSFSESLVSKHRDLDDSFYTIDDDGDLPTTMMIRNIPNQYTQKDFIQEFDSLGFKGTYDFLYIPMDKKKRTNVGYGFVNFIDHHWAAKCTVVLHNYRLKLLKKGKGAYSKYIQVVPAYLQGLEANIAHYQDKGAMGGSGRRFVGPIIVGSPVHWKVQEVVCAFEP